MIPSATHLTLFLFRKRIWKGDRGTRSATPLFNSLFSFITEASGFINTFHSFLLCFPSSLLSFSPCMLHIKYTYKYFISNFFIYLNHLPSFYLQFIFQILSSFCLPHHLTHLRICHCPPCLTLERIKCILNTIQ